MMTALGLFGKASFPRVVASNTSTDTDATATIALPAGIASGDLLVAICKNASNRTASWPAGWNELPNEQVGTNAGLSTAYRFANGSEGASINVTLSGTADSNHACYRITGAHASNAPQAGVPPAVADSENADPPNLTPSGGAKNYLWIAIGGNASSDSPDPVVFPTNYTDNQIENIHSNNDRVLAVATRNLNAASENPGAFVFANNGTAAVQAQTIAVEPA